MPTSATTRIEPIRTLHTFVVCGRGAFPLDMLRYDQCWFAHESHTPYVNMPGHRHIGLQGTKPPTEKRWESFGWTVV